MPNTPRSFLGEKTKSCSIHARECWKIVIPVLGMALDMLECTGTDAAGGIPKLVLLGQRIQPRAGWGSKEHKGLSAK